MIPKMIEEVWKPDSLGMQLYKCTKCDKHFVEPFSDIIDDYDFCPFCKTDLNNTSGVTE